MGSVEGLNAHMLKIRQEKFNGPCVLMEGVRGQHKNPIKQNNKVGLQFYFYNHYKHTLVHVFILFPCYLMLSLQVSCEVFECIPLLPAGTSCKATALR